MSSLGTWKSTPTENGLWSATTLVRIGLDGVDFGTLEKLFRIIKEQQQQLSCDTSGGVLEAYNEQI